MSGHLNYRHNVRFQKESLEALELFQAERDSTGFFLRCLSYFQVERDLAGNFLRCCVIRLEMFGFAQILVVEKSKKKHWLLTGAKRDFYSCRERENNRSLVYVAVIFFCFSE